MYAFVDETGNTGAKLLDEAQPLFMTGALLTRCDFDLRFGSDVAALSKSCGVDEIHAADMGVGGLESIAPDILRILRKAGPAFAIARIEKSYVVATKVFDTIFDSFENKAVPWHAYNIPTLRMMLVFKVAWILDDASAQAFLDALLDTNDQRAWAKMAAFCRMLLLSVPMIPDQRSRQIVSNALEWAADNPEALQFVHSNKIGRKSHLPNLIAFGNLLGGIERQSNVWKRPVDVIRHDRQQEFAAGLRFWHDMYSNARREAVEMPFGGRMVLRRVFGSNLEITNAKESAGIQMIDVIMWLFGRAQRTELPTNCQRLLDYVYGRGHMDDFSFAAAEAATRKIIDRAEATTLTQDEMEAAVALRAEIEAKRLAGMDDYAREKASSAGAPTTV